MRISTDSYKPVASNHVYGFTYDERSMMLHIQFYNGAVYAYHGVPKGLYGGFKLAPSHGCYFWDHIRQKFPTILIGKKALGFLDTFGNINYELFPDLHKLDKVDEQEKKVRQQYEDEKIECDDFHRLMDLIDIRREKIIKKLERDGYAFDNDDQLDPEVAIQESKGFNWSGMFGGIREGMSAIGQGVGEVLKIILQISAVFIALGAIMGRAGR